MALDDLVPGHALFFGLGYTARRFGRRLLDAGWRVSGTVRAAGKAAELTAEGFETHVFAPDRRLDDPTGVFDTVTHVVDSIPPTADGAPPLLVHATALRSSPALRWVAYLSTPAVYGDRAGDWAREDDPPTPGSARGERRLAAERAWVDLFEGSDVAVQVFRLAGIYGPGRSVIDQVRDGTARIIDKPGQVFNRIHVDDIGTILAASMARPDPGRIYNVADDEAAPSGDVVREACRLLGTAPPAPIPFDSAELSAMARSFYSECKRLDTTRLKDELRVTLAYPTYRDGLAALLGNDPAAP